MAKKKVTKKTAKKVVKKVAPKPQFPMFQFVGAPGRQPSDDPASTTAYGMEFALDGKPLEVRDPFIAAKLRGNSHFKES